MEHGMLSPYDMFAKADVVVKAVIFLIAILSLWSWYTIFKLWIGAAMLRRAVTRTDGAFRSVWQSPSEFHQASGITDMQFREVLSAAMKRRAQEVIDSCQGGLPLLAVVSSVAPFIGLFGTVWGIMNSFIGIAASKDTSLAVVAPGIAEALVVTALGLVAAIPASFAYNRFASGFSAINRRVSRAIDDHIDALTKKFLLGGA